MKARIPRSPAPSQGDLMKQVARMQSDMAAMQEELEGRTYEVRSGGGLVKAVMTGKKQLRELAISPDVIDPDDPDTLQDLIIAAVNEAIATVEETSAKEMEKITSQVSIPGMPGLGA